MIALDVLMAKTIKACQVLNVDPSPHQSAVVSENPYSPRGEPVGNLRKWQISNIY